MAIRDADRKLLWGRAHNRCAMCKRPLTAPAESPHLSGLVLGEEAHIIARSETGPRGDAGVRDAIDAYSNLILLCPEDHKRIDDQPDAYPADRLREVKTAHERWAEDRLDGVPGFQPIKVDRGGDEDAIPFKPLLSGTQVWDLVAGAGYYNFFPIDDLDAVDRVDAGEEFLDAIKDWGEIANEIDSLAQRRSALRSMTELLEGLWAVDVFAWGRRLTRTITGGALPPSPMYVAEVLLLTKEEFLVRYASDESGVPLAPDTEPSAGDPQSRPTATMSFAPRDNTVSQGPGSLRSQEAF